VHRGCVTVFGARYAAKPETGGKSMDQYRETRLCSQNKIPSGLLVVGNAETIQKRASRTRRGLLARGVVHNQVKRSLENGLLPVSPLEQSSSRGGRYRVGDIGRVKFSIR